MESDKNKGHNSGKGSQKNKKEENTNKDKGEPNSTRNVVATGNMKGAEHLQAILFASGSASIPQKGVTRIGNTTFLINGRLLTPLQNLVVGKRIGGHCRIPYIWSNKPRHQQITSPKNMAPYQCGALGIARDVQTELAAFNIYFTEDMLQTILTYTNEEIKISEFYILPKPTYGYPLTLTELKAFIGMLFLTAVKKDNKILTSFLWGVCGSDIYSTVMSKDRFEYLIKCLRFDEYCTRNVRKADDSFAEIRYLWEEFIKKCSEVYRPTVNCTIDEMFVDFNGNCSFKWPMPRQPKRCGIKLILLCDANNRYIISGMPYLDKNKNGAVPIAEFMVEKLATPICGTNINITYGKEWFTSVPLSKRMFNYYKLTTVGTLHTSQPEIPPVMTLEDNRPVGSSIFVYNIEDRLQLCSHYPKKGEVNIYLSNVHFNTVIDGPEGIPEVTGYYKSTKDGVEAIMKMAYGVTCSRQNVHWFLTIFFTMLDFAGINSHTIVNLNRSKCGKPPIRRVDFLYKLALDLMLPFMKEKLNDPNTTGTIKNKIKTIVEEFQKTNTICNPLSRPEKQNKVPMNTAPASSADQPKKPVAPDVKTETDSKILTRKPVQDLVKPVVVEPITSKPSNLWDEIQALYPLVPGENPKNPNLPALFTEPYRPERRKDRLKSSYLPPPMQYNGIQLPSMIPYYNYGITPQDFYMQQIQGMNYPFPSIIPIQWILPHQHLAWNPSGVAAAPQIQNGYTLRAPIKTIPPISSVPKMQQYIPNQKTADNQSSPPMKPIKTAILNLNTQPNLPNIVIQQKKVEQPTGPPNQSCQPNTSLHSTPPSPPNHQLPSPCNLPIQPVASIPSHQNATKLRKELSVCGICCYIDNSNFFTECFKCSVLLCMVHRKVVCTNCYKSVQSASFNPVMSKKGTCGICDPKEKIRFSTQCCKCSKFVCLVHRHIVCVFCLEK